MREIVPKVFIGEDPESDLKNLLSSYKYSSVAILVDDQTEKYCLGKIKKIFTSPLIISIPSGEENKTLDTCSFVWKKMTEQNLDRKALLINLGGGVIGDLGGFCAATYKRGISFINIPTTLLAQVDASIGGKVGIDFYNYKNQIGIFQEPKNVLIYTDFLKTLSLRQLISGYAEVVKHALIYDKELWQELKSNKSESIGSVEQVEKAIKIKNTIVQKDFKEENVRKLLNFGHTIGHAVESYYLKEKDAKILHGEAVAAGMIMEAFISYKKGMISSSSLEEITAYISSVFPQVYIQPEDISDIRDFLKQDKKNISGNLKFTLLQDIGKGKYDQDVSFEECDQALQYYRNLKY